MAPSSVCSVQAAEDCIAPPAAEWCSKSRARVRATRHDAKRVGGVAPLHWRQVRTLSEDDCDTPLCLSLDMEDCVVPPAAEWCSKSGARVRAARHAAKRIRKLVLKHVLPSTFLKLKSWDNRGACWLTLPGGFRAWDDIAGCLLMIEIEKIEKMKELQQKQKRRKVPTPAGNAIICIDADAEENQLADAMSNASIQAEEPGR